MSLVIVNGANLDDKIFTIDLGGVSVTWNVSKIQRAADAGFFGLPVELPLDVIPPARWDLGFLSRDGVDAIKKLPEVLDAPALLIGNPPGHDFQFRCFCDGQHRITARQELGLPTFKAFVVSHEKERRFRIFDRVVR